MPRGHQWSLETDFKLFLFLQSSPEFKTPFRLWGQDSFENQIKAVNHLREKKVCPHEMRPTTLEGHGLRAPFL